MSVEGSAGWVTSHHNVRLRPVEELDVTLLSRFDTEQALSDPFAWRGFRDPQLRRRRWEQDSYLGTDDSIVIVALPGGTFTGFVGFTAIRSSAPTAPTVTYRIGVALLPECRGQGLGPAVQCLLADHLFSTTMANRVEAGTELEKPAERRALRGGRLPKGGDFPRSRLSSRRIRRWGHLCSAPLGSPPVADTNGW